MYSKVKMKTTGIHEHSWKIYEHLYTATRKFLTKLFK